MNRHFLLQLVRMVWVVLLSVPAIALAESPYAGIYIGTYHGPRDNGEFALIVDDQGYGRLVAFDAVDAAGYVEDNIRVGSQGSFQFVNRQGVQVDGQVTSGQVAGRYGEGNRQGTFSGPRMLDDGPLLDVAGYFYGPVTMTGADSGTALHSELLAIVAPDGTAFFLLKRGYRDGADVFPDGFDLELDPDPGSSFPFDRGPGFPFGSGNVVPVGTGPGPTPTFPFGSGWGSPFNLGFFPGVGSTFGWGNSFSTSLNLGPFLSIDSRYTIGSGYCGLGWPFNVGLTFSISVSLLGSVDVEFSAGRSDCSEFASWPGLWLPVGVAGGIAQINPDGVIQASLPGGLVLNGVIDPASGMAEGSLSYQERLTAWSGNWSIDRYGAGGGKLVAKLYAQLHDFDNDGSADILWHDEVSGANVAWLMDGPDTLAALSLVYPGNPEESAQGELVAVRELDGDYAPDVVWRNAVTGEILVELSGSAGVVGVALNPAWQAIGSGEFASDPPPEFLLRHRGTGAIAVIADLAVQPELISLPAMDGQGWKSVALADFDGNGYTDILWARPSSRALRMWLMDDLAILHEVQVSTESRSQYQLAGVGDFDGDMSADLLWRRTTDGRLIVSRAVASGETEDVVLAAGAASQWQVVAVGDLDADGTDDLVWRNLLSGDNAAWMIVNAQVVGSAPLEHLDGLFWNVRN